MQSEDRVSGIDRRTAIGGLRPRTAKAEAASRYSSRRRLARFPGSRFDLAFWGSKVSSLRKERPPSTPISTTTPRYARHCHTDSRHSQTPTELRQSSEHSSEKSDELRPSLRDTSLMPQHTWSLLRTPSAWFCCSRFRTLSEGFLVSVSVRVRVSDRESASGRGRASARGSSFGGLPLRP